MAFSASRTPGLRRLAPLQPRPRARLLREGFRLHLDIGAGRDATFGERATPHVVSGPTQGPGQKRTRIPGEQARVCPAGLPDCRPRTWPWAVGACVPVSPFPTEDLAMRQHLLVLPGPPRRDACGRVTPWEGAAQMLRAGIPLMSLALLVVGCASHSLIPKEQARAIHTRERTLSPHSEAIHEAIRQSGHVGALAFLDATDGHVVVLPGNSPTDAWARYVASLPVSSPPGGVSVPAVVSFVYRADVPKAPETVPSILLQHQRDERQAADRPADVAHRASRRPAAHR